MKNIFLVLVIMLFGACATTSISNTVEDDKTVCDQLVEKVCQEEKPYLCDFIDLRIDSLKHSVQKNPELVEGLCRQSLESEKHYKAFVERAQRVIWGVN